MDIAVRVVEEEEGIPALGVPRIAEPVGVRSDEDFDRRRIAVPEIVRDLFRLIPVVAEDEEDGLPLVALVLELEPDLLPSLDPGDEDVLVLLPRVRLSLALEWLELARRRVSDDDALEDRLLYDPVRDGVLEIIPNDRVSEEIEGA